MHQQQKCAWFNLAVAGSVMMVFLALLPWVGPVRAQVAFALAGLFGLTPLFYRRRREGVVFDERDQLIALRANTVSFAFVWLSFVAACMIPWALYRQGGYVPADLLPAMLMGAWLIYVSSHAGAILLQYRFS